MAALELEIRGAGNLLGGEQSGHIEALGFDLYMKLLEQTVRELKGEEAEDERAASVNLRVDLRIDEQYVPDMSQRLTVYRRLAAARTETELDRILDEVRDRYSGHPPRPCSIWVTMPGCVCSPPGSVWSRSTGRGRSSSLGSGTMPPSTRGTSSGSCRSGPM